MKPIKLKKILNRTALAYELEKYPQEYINEIREKHSQPHPLTKIFEDTDTEAKKIINLIENGNLLDFYNMKPVDGLTLLATSVMIDEKTREKAKKLLSDAGKKGGRSTSQDQEKKALRERRNTDIRNEKTRLLELGRDPRYIANILAKKFGLTSKTIREILKK